MENLYDYKKFAILYVDDEEMSLTNFARCFGDEFRVFTAANAQAGFKLLEQHADEIGLLMTDPGCPAKRASGFWNGRGSSVRASSASSSRLMRIWTPPLPRQQRRDLQIRSKPWDPLQLEQTMKRGLEFFAVQSERDQLLREKMSVLHNMMIADRIVTLGLLAAGLSHHIRNSLVR